MSTTPAVYDYQIASYRLPTYTTASCADADCRREATHRLTVNRVETHGHLIADSFRDYCDEHIEAATAAARGLCQARLYGSGGTQGKGAA